jgi:hypothetical protein
MPLERLGAIRHASAINVFTWFEYAGLSTVAQDLWPQAMSLLDWLRSGLKAMSMRCFHRA